MKEQNNIATRLNSFFLKGWHPYFWLGVICFFLYVKTIAFRLTYFDDNLLILDNYWFLRDFRNIFRCFRESVFLGGDDVFYRPLMLVSFMIDAHIGGVSQPVYHLTNILLHACATVVLFLLFMKLSCGRERAFFLSALFAVHPALTQAVAWIPGRNDTLFAVFCFSAFVFFMEFIETANLGRLWLFLLFFNLALFTKETALMLIPAGYLYILMAAKNKLTPGRIYALVSGWLISLLLWFFLRSLSGVGVQKINAQDIRTSLAEILPGIVQYIGKMVLPFNLSVYPIVRDTTLIYGCISIVLIAAALLLTPRERLKLSFFGLAWFFLFLLPPFLLPDKMRLEHRLYVPIAGFLITLMEVDPSKIFVPKKLLSVFGALVIALFAVITYIHSDNFTSRLVFWKSAVKNSPHSSSAHNGLALRYLEYGQKDLSEQELLKAIELVPGNVNAHINLGIAYTDKGTFKDAEREFNTANMLKPDMDVLYYNYGLLCFEEGRDKDAERCWKKTLQLNQNYVYAYRSLAAYYFINGDAVGSVYYSQQLKDKFSFSAALPGSAVTDKRGWLYSYCKQGI